MRQFALAAVVAVLAAPAAASDLQKNIKKVEKFALTGNDPFSKVKERCVCTDSSEAFLFMKLGRLEYRVNTSLPAHQIQFECAVFEFDDETGEALATTSCDEFFLLTN